MTKNKAMSDVLEVAMRDALADSEKRFIAGLEKRLRIEADRAIREAWAAEIAEMAHKIVRERIKVSEFRQDILARMSAVITEELVGEVLIEQAKRISSGHRDAWWFTKEIEEAVRSRVYDAVDEARELAVSE